MAKNNKMLRSGLRLADMAVNEEERMESTSAAPGVSMIKDSMTNSYSLEVIRYEILPRIAITRNNKDRRRS